MSVPAHFGSPKPLEVALETGLTGMLTTLATEIVVDGGSDTSAIVRAEYPRWVLTEAVPALKRPIARVIVRHALLALAWFGIGTAHAGSGFVLRSQSATTLGTAQAGMTAGAEDVSSMTFNPASLSRGGGFEGAVVGTGIFTGATFSPSSATTLLGTSISGSNGGNDGTQVLLPSLYFSLDLPAGFRAGLAVTSLYGLGSYWADGWLGRYQALNSQLITEDFLLALAYEVNPALSFGVGIDVEYAKAKTASAIDLGTIDTVLSGGLAGGIQGRSDGLARTSADSVAVGFTLGALYEPVPGTRIGIGFRSGMNQNTKGTTSFEPGGPTGAAYAASGVFVPTGVTSKLSLPPTASIGLNQQLGDSWTIMADLQWMGWNTFQSLQANFVNPMQPPNVTVYNWHDSIFVAAGAKYRLQDDFAVRFGAAYDQSPTRNSTRTPAIPDSDSVWTSVGVEYRLSSAVKLDMAVGHIFVTGAPIAIAATGPGNTFRGNLTGTVHSGGVNYIAAQVSFKY